MGIGHYIPFFFYGVLGFGVADSFGQTILYEYPQYTGRPSNPNLGWVEGEDLFDTDVELRSIPPKDLDRRLRCPVPEVDTALPQGYAHSVNIDYQQPGWETRVAADWNALDASIVGYSGINVDNARPNPPSVRENARVMAIDIRYFQGVPYYRYLSNGTAHRPIENWSTTKIQGILLAGHALRHASNHRVGLNSSVNGTPVASYITEVSRSSDNAIAAWFKTIMGADAMTDFMNTWIGKSPIDPTTGQRTIGETFGGRYGVPPSNIGGRHARFVNAKAQVTIRRNLNFSSDNTLSPLTMAESFKRIVINRQDPETDSIQARGHGAVLTDEDLDQLFYGTETEGPFGGLLLGGTKTAIVEALGGKELLDRLTNGKWRIFGKSGSGRSGIRHRHEAAFLASVCLPLTATGETRLFVFFVNVQAMDGQRKYEIRNEVIRRLSRHLVPELR